MLNLLLRQHVSAFHWAIIRSRRVSGGELYSVLFTQQLSSNEISLKIGSLIVLEVSNYYNRDCEQT